LRGVSLPFEKEGGFCVFVDPLLLRAAIDGPKQTQTQNTNTHTNTGHFPTPAVMVMWGAPEIPERACMTQNLPVTIDHSVPAPQQFSRDAQADFLDALSAWGNVRSAARQAGVSRSTAYRMRRACPRFRAMWDGALLIARPQVEEVLADRALNGVEEIVYYHGEEVAKRVRYSDRLLLAHLGRLDRLLLDRGAREASYGFEQELEHLLDEPEIEFVSVAAGIAGDQGGAGDQVAGDQVARDQVAADQGEV
jgi:hypothetical protein